jgi:hypothetical protein
MRGKVTLIVLMSIIGFLASAQTDISGLYVFDRFIVDNEKYTFGADDKAFELSNAEENYGFLVERWDDAVYFTYVEYNENYEVVWKEWRMRVPVSRENRYYLENEEYGMLDFEAYRYDELHCVWWDMYEYEKYVYILKKVR